MNRILGKSLADGTRKTYASGQRQYVDFARRMGLAEEGGVIPRPDENDLVYYIVYRAAFRKSSAPYIKVLLAAVSSWFSEAGFGNVLKNDFGDILPRLARAIRGIKRIFGKPRRPRLPLTTVLLRRTIAEMDKVGGRDNVMYAAAMSFAVYGLLRQSEFTSEKTSAFNEERQARRKDVWFELDADGKVEAMCFFLRVSKNDQWRSSQTVRYFVTGTAECPVTRMRQYLANTEGADRNGPLFALKSGKFLTRAALARKLRSALVSAGCSGAAAFSTHSFRQGGAVSLQCAGQDAEGVISVMGRWRSDAYKAYLSMDRAHLRQIVLAMANVDTEDVEAWGDREWR